MEGGGKKKALGHFWHKERKKMGKKLMLVGERNGLTCTIYIPAYGMDWWCNSFLQKIFLRKFLTVENHQEDPIVGATATLFYIVNVLRTIYE